VDFLNGFAKTGGAVFIFSRVFKKVRTLRFRLRGMPGSAGSKIKRNKIKKKGRSWE
jgi:hypothetical protein